MRVFDMTEDDKVKAIKFWQENDAVHSLTCKNSTHKPLVGLIVEGCVILKCIDCDYEQHWIPPIVLWNWASQQPT